MKDTGHACSSGWAFVIARRWALLVTFALAACPMRAARAVAPGLPAPENTSAGSEAPRAVFALIIGVNRSPSANVAPLQYADDDAARYLDLFRGLGARTYVLTRLDVNTRGLHPQAAAEAVFPRGAALRAAVGALARDIEQAHARGVKSTLYVAYAGHGEVDAGAWYLTLEDQHLSGAQFMSDVVERAGADQSHVIIDACHAHLLATARGPGGTRRPLAGFVELEAASRAGRVGYLLSTSVSGESHEWAGFEAGVFSHEVRSGLYGAADANGDGLVDYAEIGAFVARANQAITNDRFRPRVLARAPRDVPVILDLRGGEKSRLRLGAPASGAHYLLEDRRGVRVLDFHGDGATAVKLLRPPGEGPLYLRNVADGTERIILRQDGIVELDPLPVLMARAGTRGAAHEAFTQIFSVAFDQRAVAHWQESAHALEGRIDAHARAVAVARAGDERRAQLRRRFLMTAVGVGVSAGMAAVVLDRSAHALHDGAPSGESQRDTIVRNQRIATRNHWARGLAIGGAVAGLSGALLWLWPSRPTEMPELQLAVSDAGAAVSASWRF